MAQGPSIGHVTSVAFPQHSKVCGGPSHTSLIGIALWEVVTRRGSAVEGGTFNTHSQGNLGSLQLLHVEVSAQISEPEVAMQLSVETCPWRCYCTYVVLSTAPRWIPCSAFHARMLGLRAAHLDAAKVRLGHMPRATHSQPVCVSRKPQRAAPSPLPQESIQAHFKVYFETIICKLQKAERKPVWVIPVSPGPSRVLGTGESSVNIY